MSSLSSHKALPLSPHDKHALAQADFSFFHIVWSFLLALTLLTTSQYVAMESQRTFETKTAFLYAYYYSSLSSHLSNPAAWWIPWPNNFVGRIGWYRQGLQEVRQHRDFIQSLTSTELPTILVAAAIANQGNSPQRPFGWDGLERFQRWLGYRFEWQFTAWDWAYARWTNYFEAPSVGIGQIQPNEARRLTYAGDRINLFSDRASIGLMQAKLINAAHLFSTLELNQTELFALLAVSNNDNSDGLAILHQFERANYDLALLISHEAAIRRQLARMMTYIDYLHTYDCWEIPNGVNLDYLWWLVHNAQPKP